MAMISSDSCRVVAPIVLASAGLVIIWFMWFMAGFGVCLKMCLLSVGNVLHHYCYDFIHHLCNFCCPDFEFGYFQITII